jgi:hypothetical protein
MSNEFRFVGDIRWFAYDIFARQEYRDGCGFMRGIALGALRCGAQESYASASHIAGRALNFSAAANEPSVISSEPHVR